ncbi:MULTISPECIES: LysR family transcriptional regulator [unclassified Marinobacter]|uniref:LysR family transcriptional regulator n=1 Tax=unclassified Marinobacter TaxID=83889 RepID=UPI000BF78879|nr:MULTISPECIES: LysR family transcriptional regulator [unclassified Marinobacter]PFG08707.1 transcriptional regulator, LysR family [Marinobacter sp. LV10MA510-1]PFG54539.1 transcriptional regulator, LysR family [Marinobacter sp. LV10R520-4]
MQKKTGKPSKQSSTVTQKTRSLLAWNDFEIILAIVNAGSLSGASRALGVSHATIFRRLGDIEQRLGVTLFERSRTGYRPTLAGEELADTARIMDEAALAAERKVAGRDLEPSGEIWTTTTDSLLMGLLAPLFTQFRHKYPGIVLDVAISNELFNLTRREADVAIRPSNSPPENLIGRPLTTIGQAVYGHRSFGLTPGASVEALVSQPWIGAGPRLKDSALDQWMDNNELKAACVYRVDTLVSILSAIRSGMGLAVLPCYLADEDPDIIQLTNPIPELEYGLWFLMHPDLRGVVRIHALMDFLTEAVRAQKQRLAGPLLR